MCLLQAPSFHAYALKRLRAMALLARDAGGVHRSIRHHRQSVEPPRPLPALTFQTGADVPAPRRFRAQVRSRVACQLRRIHAPTSPTLDRRCDRTRTMLTRWRVWWPHGLCVLVVSDVCVGRCLRRRYCRWGGTASWSSASSCGRGTPAPPHDRGADEDGDIDEALGQDCWPLLAPPLVLKEGLPLSRGWKGDETEGWGALELW
jgi:hypothetical protein